MKITKHLIVAFFISIQLAPIAQADVVSFQASDFGLTPTFSNVQTFEFSIDLGVSITAGSTYVNPTLNGVVYHVFGTLTNTPSGFPAFDLNRTIGGAEFYNQGSSLSFTVDAAADLSDGLQVSELTGSDPVFLFNGREVGTGRYHPSLFQLNADGTGSIRNSNNIGGINPGSNMEVNVDFGDEYITELTFDPNTLTIAIPEPSTVALLFPAGVALFLIRRKRNR